MSITSKNPSPMRSAEKAQREEPPGGRGGLPLRYLTLSHFRILTFVLDDMPSAGHLLCPKLDIKVSFLTPSSHCKKAGISRKPRKTKRAPQDKKEKGPREKGVGGGIADGALASHTQPLTTDPQPSQEPHSFSFLRSAPPPALTHSHLPPPFQGGKFVVPCQWHGVGRGEAVH